MTEEELVKRLSTVLARTIARHAPALPSDNIKVMLVRGEAGDVTGATAAFYGEVNLPAITAGRPQLTWLTRASLAEAFIVDASQTGEALEPLLCMAVDESPTGGPDGPRSPKDIAEALAQVIANTYLFVMRMFSERAEELIRSLRHDAKAANLDTVTSRHTGA